MIRLPILEVAYRPTIGSVVNGAPKWRLPPKFSNLVSFKQCYALYKYLFGESQNHTFRAIFKLGSFQLIE